MNWGELLTGIAISVVPIGLYWLGRFHGFDDGKRVFAPERWLKDKKEEP